METVFEKLQHSTSIAERALTLCTRLEHENKALMGSNSDLWRRMSTLELEVIGLTAWLGTLQEGTSGTNMEQQPDPPAEPAHQPDPNPLPSVSAAAAWINYHPPNLFGGKSLSTHMGIRPLSTVWHGSLVDSAVEQGHNE